MRSLGYRLLGYTVWNGGSWYLRRRLRRWVPSPWIGIATVGGLAAAGVIVHRART